MKKTLYTILISAALLSGLSLMSSNAYADCQPIYGGGQTCANNFSIQKFVQTPGKGGGSFVNNLSINDPRFAPSQTVTFQIEVKNTGSQQIPTLTITDAFPQFLTFVSGPGSFDTSSKVLTFTVNNLDAGKSQTFTVSGKVAESGALPTNTGIMCLINQVSATDSNGMTNGSSSQFCVEKKVLGASEPQIFAAPKVVTTPATGPEMLPLLALIPGGLGGLILRKKSLSIK